MLRKLIIIAVALAVLFLGIGNIILFLKKNSLQDQLNETKHMVQTVQRDLDAITKEKNKIAEEKDKLQSDAVSYMAINEKLQGEKENLKDTLEKARKSLDAKEAALERMKDELQSIESKASEKQKKEESTAEKEAKNLKKKIYLVDKKLQVERALYHYNLGVAFTHAKRYNEAVTEYEKALELAPDNAEAHYNLALVYDGALDNAVKATYHYEAYLKLKPKAPDADDVRRAIKNLQK